MPYSTFQIAGLLNLVWGAQAFPAPSTMQLFLSTTDPGVLGTARTEPVGNGYAQVAITNNTTNWPVVSGSPKVNGVDISFPAAAGSWGTIAYAGFDDGDGNFLGSGALTFPKAITAGDIVFFPAGSLSIAMS